LENREGYVSDTIRLRWTAPVDREKPSRLVFSYANDFLWRR